jgi:hypothetical protein
MLHAFLLGLAFGAITVFGLFGAVRLDRYEVDRDAEWRSANNEPTDIGEKSEGAEEGTAFVPASAPTFTVLDGGASDRGV